MSSGNPEKSPVNIGAMHNHMLRCCHYAFPENNLANPGKHGKSPTPPPKTTGDLLNMG